MSLQIWTLISQNGLFIKLIQILVGDNLSYIFKQLIYLIILDIDIINQLYLSNSLYLSKYL